MNKLISKEEVLSFDDVILVPGYSDLKSRKNIDTSINILYNNIRLTYKLELGR